MVEQLQRMVRWLALAALALAAMVGIVAAPGGSVLAQGGDGDDIPVLIELIGTVEVVEDDLIVVDGYTIAPAGMFDPSGLNVGDRVAVTGYLLNDDTLLVVSLEVVTDLDEDGIDDAADNCPEIANEDQADADADGVGDACAADEDDTDDDAADEGDTEEEPDDTAACDRVGHPVVTALANEFDLDYATVIGWHCDGTGLGEIARALLLAEASGDDVEAILARQADGEGWGNILRDYDVRPNELGNGRVISGRHGNDDADEDAAPGNNGNGRGNGNSSNNGNNGRGNGNNGNNGNGNN